MKKAKTVGEYIEGAPEEYQHKLIELRSLMKNHIGLYIPPPIIENHKKDLKDYRTTKSSVHLFLDKPLPKRLITKLIKARVKWNEESKLER